MKVDFIVNNTVSLMLSPDNPMEEELLKQLTKQTLDIVEIRSTLHLINRTIREGIMIASKTEMINLKENDTKEETVLSVPVS